MDDVLVIGAGPAGSVAATVLARAGARVRMIDRARFPRDKLCGDTINPGTLALLGRLDLAAGVEAPGRRVDGMLVTGEGGISIEGRYPDHLHGICLRRRELDGWLLESAAAAGVEIECGVAASETLIAGDRREPIVEGVRVGPSGSTRALRAPVTIAADGRHSTLGFGLGLARHPASPRRWAVGGYFEGDGPRAGAFGEMHVRNGRYIGIAPVKSGLTNVCLVTQGEVGALANPAAVLRCTLAADLLLRDRFAGARLVDRPTVLGPLAVDTSGGGIDGLVFAGDAAGFVDPMTGDGLRFAIRGGELAAVAALEALEHGWHGVRARLAAARQHEFAAKWRFNRTLRALVASPAAVRVATLSGRFAPWVVRALIARAGDCDVTA